VDAAEYAREDMLRSDHLLLDFDHKDIVVTKKRVTPPRLQESPLYITTPAAPAGLLQVARAAVGHKPGINRAASANTLIDFPNRSKASAS
jgi:hypothetical protein